MSHYDPQKTVGLMVDEWGGVDEMGSLAILVSIVLGTHLSSTAPDFITNAESFQSVGTLSPIMRWPGGCFADTYHWKDAVGPQADRKPIANRYWGGGLEDNSFGTDRRVLSYPDTVINQAPQVFTEMTVNVFVNMGLSVQVVD